MRNVTTLLLLLTILLAGSMRSAAQTAETLYKQAKTYVDAKNYTAAVPLLKKAATKGDKKAQYRLARCYDKGHGVDEDNKAAFGWYQKSATQGYAKAQYRLAKCYLKGKGTAADPKKARTWLKKAVAGKKHGKEILDKIKTKAAEGDDDAKRLLALLKQ